MSEQPQTEAPLEEVPLEEQYAGEPTDDDIPDDDPDAGKADKPSAEEATTPPPEEGASRPAPAAEPLHLDAETIAAANQVGITPQEASHYTTTRALDNEIIRRAHESRIREGQKQPAPYALSLDELGLDEVDPAIKQAFKKVGEHYEKREAAMQARLGESEKQLKTWQDQQNVQHTAENQRQFNAWRKGVPQLDDVLGPGQIQDLQPGSAEHKNMESLAREVYVQAKAEELRPGGTRATPQDIFNRAAGIVFAEQMNKQSATKLKTDLKKRSKGATHRPAARQNTPDARKAVMDKWEELHQPDGSAADNDDADPEV